MKRRRRVASEGYIKRILTAKVYDVAVETPIDRMPGLSDALRNEILVKREDLQPVFCFKLRGAYNKIAQLTAAQQRRGVVAASAGNHAQGVALAACRHEVEATIVMPKNTPAIKIEAVRSVGGRWVEVLIHGDRFDEACDHALALASAHNRVFVHPYDDRDVIAGQGTVGMEIMRQCPGDLDAVFVQVGGGGLIAGVGTYIKYVRPDVKIIAVEAEESACLQAAMKVGRRVRLPVTGIFVDGVSVAQVGREPFRLARECVDDLVTVSNDEICAAIKLMYDDTRSIAEPAGAASLAGLVKYARRRRWRNKSLLAINSGANVNFDRLRYVSERYKIGQGNEVMLAITIDERAGSLLELCEVFGAHDITEFNYRYVHATHAHVLVGVTVRGEQDERRALLRRIRERGFAVQDLSGNELAKQHICHMVGGPAEGVVTERILRLEFPERPGILQEFLSFMQARWNISLFHYRQTGGSYANVLIGLQPLPGQPADIDATLRGWKYPYVDETENPAYRMFLRPHSARGVRQGRDPQ